MKLLIPISLIPYFCLASAPLSSDKVEGVPVNGVWAGEDYVTFQFDSDQILISIEYAVSRP